MTAQTIDAAMEAVRQGRMVILADGTQDEAQLCMAAELVSADAINFMATHGRGLVCLCLTSEHMRRMGIPLMVPDAVGSGRWLSGGRCCRRLRFPYNLPTRRQAPEQLTRR